MSLELRLTQILVLGILYSVSFASVNLTSSSDSDVCPGDTVVFTCVTDTGQLQWSGSLIEANYYLQNNEHFHAVYESGIFDLQFINPTGMILVSTATVVNVSLDNDGINITCTDDFNNPDSFEMESIVLALLPSQPLNVSFSSACEAIITISWIAPLDTPLCVHSYSVTIDTSIIDFSQVYNTSDNRTSLNITNLIPGNEYNVTVAGRDGAGQLGKIIGRLLNLSICEIFSNLTYNQFQLGESVVLVIHWSKVTYYSFDYYLIKHNITLEESPIITNQTNVAFFEVQDGDTYSVEISPFSGKLKCNSISKIILISAVFNMGPTMINKMCTVDDRIENTYPQWNITTGHKVAIFSSVFLIVIVMCYLMICLFVAATDNRNHQQLQHHENRVVQEIEYDKLSSSTHESQNHEAEPNQDSDTVYEYVRHEY